jgi:hypothetical protein
MSEPDEKLDRVVTSEGLPRATLEQLLKMWGAPEGIDPKHPPEVIAVNTMGVRKLWMRVGRAEGGKTVFELRSGG